MTLRTKKWPAVVRDCRDDCISVCMNSQGIDTPIPHLITSQETPHATTYLIFSPCSKTTSLLRPYSHARTPKGPELISITRLFYKRWPRRGRERILLFNALSLSLSLREMIRRGEKEGEVSEWMSEVCPLSSLYPLSSQFAPPPRRLRVDLLQIFCFSAPYFMPSNSRAACTNNITLWNVVSL